MSVLKYLDGETYKALPFSTAGTQMKLLWENASPGSSFTAQTIGVNLIGFDGVLIKLRRVGTMQEISGSILCNVGESFKVDMTDFSGGDSGDLIYVFRTGSVTKTGVIFSRVDLSFFDGNKNLDYYNNWLIPYQIYGIKGVQY